MIRLALLALVAATLAYVVFRFRRDAREDAIARARAAFFVRSAGPSGQGRQTAPVREVTLSEGRLRFRIPRAWEGEPSATATFEARASSLRVFRAGLVSAPAPGHRGAEEIAEALRLTEKGRAGVVSVLPGERVLLKHVEAGSDDRGPSITYCWELHVAGPHVARFAFQVPGGSLDAITEDDLRLLEREIREARL